MSICPGVPKEPEKRRERADEGAICLKCNKIFLKRRELDKHSAHCTEQQQETGETLMRNRPITNETRVTGAIVDEEPGEV